MPSPIGYAKGIVEESAPNECREAHSAHWFHKEDGCRESDLQHCSLSEEAGDCHVEAALVSI